MYFPSLVFPYQRVPGLWYTPDSVFTQTMPALFAGGACFGAAAGFDAGALLLGALAGVVAAGAAAGVAGGVAAGAFVLAAAGVEVGAVAEEADFLERLFFGVAASSVLAAPAAGADWSGVAFFDFPDDFLAGAAASAVSVLSAASAFFEDFFLEDPFSESAAGAWEIEALASAPFFFLLFFGVLESVLV